MMYYCDHCKIYTNDPVLIKDSFTHLEVDTRQEETFNLPICPVCSREVEEASKCACGEGKTRDAEWCKSCLEVRDNAVIRAINRIRMDTHLALTRDETKDLILSYFDED